MSEIELAVYLPLIIDFTGVALIWWALSSNLTHNIPLPYRLGLAITGIGFLWQINSSIQVLFYSATIGRVTPPLWLFKDLGMVMLLCRAYYDLYVRGKDPLNFRGDSCLRK